MASANRLAPPLPGDVSDVLHRAVSFLGIAVLGLTLLVSPSGVSAFAITGLYGVDSNGLYSGYVPPAGIDDAPRWDTGDLSGGLTYNFGQWSEAVPNHGWTVSDPAQFLDLFTWAGAKPTLDDFDSAINAAFSAWQFGQLTFTKTTHAVGTGITAWPTPAFDGSNLLGNSIDIYAVPGGGFYGGLTVALGNADDVHLTNGFGFASLDYLFPSSNILAVDLGLSTSTVWTLPMLQGYLTHELGHAIGLGDVDLPRYPASASMGFWDTDSDFTNVMPIDMIGDVRDGLPAFPTLNPVNYLAADGKILMCSQCPSAPLTLKNDDLAGLHFLYPSVPEPGTVALFGVGIAGLAAFRRRRR